MNIFTQKPTLANVLPIQFEEDEVAEKIPFQLYEPSIEQMLPDLLKHYVEMKVYQHLLEHYLSEQASRMMAMQNATTNAQDIITQLKLEYNKARQEKITSEILDISSSSLFV